MKLPKIVVQKIPFTYQSSYKCKIQTKIVLLWWKMRVGRVEQIRIKNTKGQKDWNFWLITMPTFKEGVIDG